MSTDSIQKIDALEWYPDTEDKYLIEDKRNGNAQKADSHQNDRRHILPVSLLVWPLALPLCTWSGSLSDQNMSLSCCNF